jgi:hypothetical protein
MMSNNNNKVTWWLVKTSLSVVQSQGSSALFYSRFNSICMLKSQAPSRVKNGGLSSSLQPTRMLRPESLVNFRLSKTKMGEATDEASLLCGRRSRNVSSPLVEGSSCFKKTKEQPSETIPTQGSETLQGSVPVGKFESKTRGGQRDLKKINLKYGRSIIKKFETPTRVVAENINGQTVSGVPKSSDENCSCVGNGHRTSDSLRSPLGSVDHKFRCGGSDKSGKSSTAVSPIDGAVAQKASETPSSEPENLSVSRSPCQHNIFETQWDCCHCSDMHGFDQPVNVLSPFRKRCGWRVHSIAKDGDCFYSSVCHALRYQLSVGRNGSSDCNEATISRGVDGEDNRNDQIEPEGLLLTVKMLRNVVATQASTEQLQFHQIFAEAK